MASSRPPAAPQIVCIPPEMLQALWPHVGPWLVKGQLEIFGDVQKALVAVAIIAVAIQEKRMQCWAVIDEPAKRVVAAVVTQIRLIEDRRIVWVAGLGGEGAQHWGTALSDRLIAFARAEDAAGCQYVARKAALRLYPGSRIVGEEEPGLYVLERAA